MTAEDDLKIVGEQEKLLEFDRFDLAAAWSLGSRLRELSISRSHVLAIDVHINGMQAFFTSLPGAKPDFEHWIRRKRNLVQRFQRSSYAIGLDLAQQQASLESKWGLPTADFAAHGGCVPIKVTGVGCIGTVTVSGLPQREDHNLVVEGLARELGVWDNLPKLA